MGCACNERGRDMYEIVMNGGTGRVAWKNRNLATAQTVAGKYKGSVLRKQGTTEIIFHEMPYEVARTEKGPAIFASADLDAAKDHAAGLETAYVRDAGTKEVVHTHPEVLGRVAAMQEKVAAESAGTATLTKD